MREYNPQNSLSLTITSNNTLFIVYTHTHIQFLFTFPYLISFYGQKNHYHHNTHSHTHTTHHKHTIKLLSLLVQASKGFNQQPFYRIKMRKPTKRNLDHSPKTNNSALLHKNKKRPLYLNLTSSVEI